MNSISVFWEKITSAGIGKDFDIELKTQVKVLNSLAVLCGFFAAFNLTWALYEQLQLLALLDLIAFISMSLVCFLNYSGKYLLARSTFFAAITALIIFIDATMNIGVYFYFFPLTVFAAYLFRNRFVLLAYFLLLLVAYLFLKTNAIQHSHTAYDPSIEWMGSMKSLIISFILTFLAVLVFRKQSQNNREEILSVNEQLKETSIDSDEKAKFAELLLQEMNHRMKNNLQLISSLLNIHAAQLNDKQAKEAVLNARMRISSISLIHKQLYKDKLVSTIDLADYVDNLVPFIKESLALDNDDININVSAEPIDMPMEDAVSVGLIINEALTNSIRHGVKDLEKKEIKLLVKRTKEDEIKIVVTDNGSGIQRMNEEKNTGFGSELISTLVANFNGKTVIDDKLNQLTIYLQYKSSGFIPGTEAK